MQELEQGKQAMGPGRKAAAAWVMRGCAVCVAAGLFGLRWALSLGQIRPDFELKIRGP